MILVPSNILIQCQGKRFRPAIAEITGLSPARIGKGNLDKIHPSTSIRVAAHIKRFVMDNAERNGLSGEVALRWMNATPKLSDGTTAPWAALIYTLQIPEELELPLSISYALAIDELLYAMLHACEAGNLTAFKQALVNFENSPHGFGNPAEVETDESIGMWRDATDWLTVGALLSALMENLYFSILAALDAEWGSQYFRCRKPVPLFLWVAPRLNEKFDPSNGKKPPSNLIYRPVRRLFEFGYALIYYRWKKKWPNAPIGRSELGKALELSDASVGNYFDGTRNLTTKAFDSHWQKFCSHHGELFAIPLPIILLAIHWQKTLIKTTSGLKFKSTILMDEDKYRLQWQQHRDRWADQLLPAGKGKWPAWLINQRINSLPPN